MANPLKKRNFRDLSYLVSEDGLRLKPGLFLRSSALNKLSKKEQKALANYSISEVIDLRTDGEIFKKPDALIKGSMYSHFPIVDAELLGITHEKGLKGYKAPPDMPWLYKQIVTKPTSMNHLGEALRKLFSLEDGPRLWHCSAGKDRCGILTALFLVALGYKEEDILKDYELSDKPNRKKGRLYRNLIMFLLFKRKLAIGVYKAMLADRAYLLSAFSAMTEKAGSLQNYILTELNLNLDSINAFKAKFMIKA